MNDTRPTKIDLRQHPADLADALQRLPSEEAAGGLLTLPAAVAPLVMAELDDAFARNILREIDTATLTEWWAQLDADQVADLASILPDSISEPAIENLAPHDREAVRELLKYPEDTAGGIMSDLFITLSADETLRESLQKLRANPEHRKADITYLYVTDQDERLIGVVPLRELLFASPDKRVHEAMNSRIKFLRVTDDQEEIAREFEKYHYLGLPVLEADNRLVGIVKVSDVLEVAEAEATEDMQLMVGLSGEERALTPWHIAVVKRLPWLCLNLATALLGSWVILQFESTTTRWAALIAFLPVIAGQSGNAGMQTLTVIIRDLALGELSNGDGRRALAKELIAGLINGLAIGLILGLIGHFWMGSTLLGIVAAVAMIMSQTAAVAAGVLIPLGLKLFRIDPALASSIFLTTVTDVLGFFFFLGLAYLALQWQG